MATRHEATTTAFLSDRYQARPARKKKRGGCLPRLLVFLLALALTSCAAYLGGVKGEALMVAAGILVILGFPLSVMGGAKEE